MRMPASSARSCSSFSRVSSGDGGKRHEAAKRRAPVSVDADMVIERALAVRRRGPGEIERAQASGDPSGEPTTFTTFGSVRSSSLVISAAMVPISASPSSSAPRQARTRLGSSVGKSPWRLTMVSSAPSGSSLRHGLENAVRAAHVIGARHQRLAAGRRAPPRRSASASATTTHGAAIGLDRAAPDMHDHGLAGDIGERLVRQPCGLEPRRDDNEIGRHGGQITRRSGLRDILAGPNASATTAPYAE